MRVIIKPAHPQAAILDPDRGRNLPPDGVETELTPHWIGLEQRGDVIVEEIASEAAEPAENAPPQDQ